MVYVIRFLKQTTLVYIYVYKYKQNNNNVRLRNALLQE